MKSLKSHLSHTLSVKLSLWVVTFATVLFVAVLWVMLWFARQAVRDEVTGKARATLDSAALTIENELMKVETVARNMLWNVEHHLGDRDAMLMFSRQMLEANPTIEGCAIAFNQGDFMACHHRVGNTIIRSDKVGDVPYTKQAWYARPFTSGKAEWADPTLIRNYSPHSITTYSLPIRNASGEVVGIFAVDISLDWLSRTIQAARPFPNTYCALINQNGSYIIHPDRTLLGSGSLMSLLKNHPDTDGARLVKAMMDGESGSMRVKIYGQDCFVCYRPFKTAGWSLDVVCPENEMFASYYELRHLVSALTVVGLVVLLVFCLYYINRQLRPLYRLDDKFRQLGCLQFSTRGTSTSKAMMPDLHPGSVSRKDEIGHLQRAFGAMQQSLSAYLEEIDLQQAKRDERGEALRHAYEHTKEADKAKAAFMHSATDQLMAPVAVISDVVGKIYAEHTQLAHDEMVKMTGEIETHTKTVTGLLDRMIEVSSI